MRTTCCPVSHRRALTLIELLAVIVILSMVAGVGMTRLSAVDEAARIDAYISRWRELDAKARVLAQQGRHVTLRIGASQMQLLVEDSAQDLAFAPIPFPAAGVIRISISGGEVTEIGYDARGASPDYVLEVISENRTVAWRTSGATGWVEQHKETGR